MVVFFIAVLFELSRYVVCFLLIGLVSLDVFGLVFVVKYKVRDFILSSRVVYLVEGGFDSDEIVRDRFFRLRYRSEV